MADSIKPYYDPLLDKIRSIDQDSEGTATFDPFLNEIRMKDKGDGVVFDGLLGKVRKGALLNLLPVIPDGTPTSVYDVTDTAFKVISSVSTNSSTVVELEYGTASGVYTNTVTAAESPVTETGDVNFSLTGLTPYTDYYFRVKAVNSAGTAYSQEFVQKTAWQNTAPSLLTLTVISDTQINLSWTDNSIGEDDFRIERSTDGINYTEIGNTTGTTFNNTSLNTYTQYYYRVRARQGTNYSNYSNAANATTLFNATLTATGTGAGVSTLRLEVSENQTLTITSGTARFYTDAAGTLGESTTWAVTTGALRTIYLKAPSGSSVLNIPKPDKVTKWGNSSTDGWTSATNAARISIEVGKLALTELWMTGTSTLTGALPTGLTYLRLDGSQIAWTYSGALPTGLTVLYLSGLQIAWTYSGALPTGLTVLYLVGSQIAWTYSGALPTGLTFLSAAGNVIDYTGLDVGNNGNIITFNLNNYRIAKMSSADMVTLLTHLTNRTGSLPNTITINDYVDFASPPASVTNAVAALKVAKPNITTVNLGA